MSDWEEEDYNESWEEAWEQGADYEEREPEYFDVTCAECGQLIGTMKRYWRFPDMRECYELEDGEGFETRYKNSRQVYYHLGCC